MTARRMVKMTEALKRALDQVEHLSADAPDEIARLIEREIAGKKWDELFASEASDRFLEELVAEARREDDAGLTVESTDRW
jgi:hypothetical protein